MAIFCRRQWATILLCVSYSVKPASASAQLSFVSTALADSAALPTSTVASVSACLVSACPDAIIPECTVPAAAGIIDTLIIDTLIADTLIRDTIPGVTITRGKDTLAPYRSKDWFKQKGYRINRTYLVSMITDFPKVAGIPAQYTGKDWLHAGLMAGGAGLLLFADKGIQRFMRANQSQFLNETAEIIEPFGNTYPPIIMAGLYLTSVVTKNRRMEHASLMAAKSLVYTTAFYTTTKTLIRRQRPLYTDDPLKFNAPFGGGKEFTSFPSGHTNTVFTAATAIAMEYKHIKWVPVVAYSIATLTAASRLYHNRHWASDIWVGAAFGHFITRALYIVEERKNKKKTMFDTGF